MIDVETSPLTNLTTGNASEAETLGVDLSAARRLAADLAELTKARVNTFLVLTAACGYFLAARSTGHVFFAASLFHALLGVGMVSGGSAALNEVLECDIDERMQRTARRPIPAGRMRMMDAAIVGAMLVVCGSLYLAYFSNALTAVIYLGVYTPLKRVSPICTAIGAIPGAMPAVLGWTALTGRLDWASLALFAILFFWQFPHFFSIAWLYRDDYARGGIRMLPVVEPTGRSTAWRILLYSVILLPVSLLPTYLGMAGRIYAVGAALLGLLLLSSGVRLARLTVPIHSALSRSNARRLLRTTILYLPLLLVLLMLDSQHH